MLLSTSLTSIVPYNGFISWGRRNSKRGVCVRVCERERVCVNETQLCMGPGYGISSFHTTRRPNAIYQNDNVLHNTYVTQYLQEDQTQCIKTTMFYTIHMSQNTYKKIKRNISKRQCFAQYVCHTIILPPYKTIYRHLDHGLLS